MRALFYLFKFSNAFFLKVITNRVSSKVRTNKRIKLFTLATQKKE